jgi:hypothetical protein
MEPDDDDDLCGHALLSEILHNLDDDDDDVHYLLNKEANNG